MISLFLPSLYADQLGVPLGAIGQVTSAVQIFDALTDPVLGYVSVPWAKREKNGGSSSCLQEKFQLLMKFMAEPLS